MRFALRGRSDQPKVPRLIQLTRGIEVGIGEHCPTNRIGKITHRVGSWLGSQAPEVAELVRRMPAPIPAA